VITKRCLQRQPPLPHHSVSELRHGDLLFVSEPLNLAAPLDRAIHDVGHATIAWLRQRKIAVARDDIAEHVAMVVADGLGHAVAVVEAARICGVRVLPLNAFFQEFMPGSRFFHGQLAGATRDQASKAVSFAMQRAGAPYSDDFSAPSPLATTPWTQAFYCSSLVDYAYREALGRETVFTEEPFPLTFVPEDFWDGYYREQGRARPQGDGSNPTLLLHSPAVRYSALHPSVAQPREEVHELF